MITRSHMYIYEQTYAYTHLIRIATYLNLDEDHNGMLSKREFKGYGGGTLTNAFVDRIFQEYRMYDREMVRMCVCVVCIRFCMYVGV